jgi:hypothetical protein
VADDVCRLAVLGGDEVDDVPGELADAVGTDTVGLLAPGVTALVGDDHAVAGVDQRLDVLAPLVPELGEPVQQDDERVGQVPRGDDVQGDAVRLAERRLGDRRKFGVRRRGRRSPGVGQHAT